MDILLALLVAGLFFIGSFAVGRAGRAKQAKRNGRVIILLLAAVACGVVVFLLPRAQSILEMPAMLVASVIGFALGAPVNVRQEMFGRRPQRT